MKIVSTDEFFELHIISAVTSYYVNTNNKMYHYKRLVIPKLLIDYFSEINADDLMYMYLYFVNEKIFLDVHKLDHKFSKRKLMKFKSKNSYFINLNTTALSKNGVTVGDEVLFIIGVDSELNSGNKISVEVRFI